MPYKIGDIVVDNFKSIEFIESGEGDDGDPLYKIKVVFLDGTIQVFPETYYWETLAEDLNKK